MSPIPFTPLTPAIPPFPEVAWRGIFGDYRAVMDGISECPDVFHFANLLAVIAAEFGDRARLQEAKATFPNFYIFCCGHSGSRKSTATDLVEEHVVAHMPIIYHHAMTSVSSAEGLIRALNDYPNLLMRYDEIADLFSTAARSGQRLEPNLNKGFDLRPLESIIKSRTQSQLARDYCLNIIFNGTPDHVRLELSEGLFKGGLLNRLLVFVGAPTGKPMPEMGMPALKDAQEIAARIAAATEEWRKLQQFRGGIRVRLSPEAKEIHSLWYTRHTLAMHEMDELDAKPLTRLDTYAKKLGMVYCLMETEPTLSPAIAGEHMEAALEVVAYCQASMLWMTRQWGGPKSTTQQAESLTEERIKGYLAQRGCAREREIYRQLHLSGRECRLAVDALAWVGVVTVINDVPRMVHFKPKCKCFELPPGVPPIPLPGVTL